LPRLVALHRPVLAWRHGPRHSARFGLKTPEHLRQEVKRKPEPDLTGILALCEVLDLIKPDDDHPGTAEKRSHRAVKNGELKPYLDRAAMWAEGKGKKKRWYGNRAAIEEVKMRQEEGK